MAARTTWPLPDMSRGTTLSLSTDHHFGERTFTQAWLDRCGRDLIRLKDHSHGYVLTGDMTDWAIAGPTGYTADDAAYIAWRDTVKATGKPYIDIPGNHDLEDHTVTNSNTYRTSAAWASVMGRSQANGVLDIGHLRIIAVVPDIWRLVDEGDPHQNFVISPEMFSWMTEQVNATTRPVVIAAHLTPREHYGAGKSAAQPEVDVAAWVGANPRVIGWLSGHQHSDPLTPSVWAKVITVGGREIFSINAPAAGGRMVGTTSANHQFQSRQGSVYVSFYGNTCEVRIRNHHDASWYPGPAILDLATPTTDASLGLAPLGTSPLGGGA